jgi:L-ascorbate metabolism protein UlaG (beta-lactamase superfamily)
MRTNFFLFICLATFNVNLLYSQLKHNELQITNVANEGFLIKSQNHKVLIDALFTDGYGLFAVPPKETINQIMEARAPFDSVQLCLLTHYHYDHCDPLLINQYLKKYKDITLLASKPTLIFIDGVCFGFVQMKKQFCETTPEINQSISKTIHSIPVKVLGLKHLSFYKDGIDLEEYMYNVGYLLDMDGIKVFHGGDMLKNNLQDYIAKNGKWKDKIDVAFLNYEFFKSGLSDLEYILSTLNPKYIVIMHVPPGLNDEWTVKVEELKKRFPNIIFFKNSMEAQILKLNN